MGSPEPTLIAARELPVTAQNGGTVASVRSLWLETPSPTEPNRVLLSANGRAAAVSRSSSVVSYISEGSLYICPIVEIERAKYEALLAAYERNKTLSRARMAGLALIMYAADNNDVMPGSKADIQTLVGKYLRDGTNMGDFVYTFAGGPVTAVINPSKTEMGYIALQNGRAVVFLDGHVEFVPN